MATIDQLGRAHRVPAPGEVSLWETLEASPNRLRIRHQGLVGDFKRVSQVAGTLRVDSVISCKAIPWSHRLTIDFRPDNGVAEWFLDQAERSFEDLLASEMHEAKPRSVPLFLRLAATRSTSPPGQLGSATSPWGPVARDDGGRADRAGYPDGPFLADVELRIRSFVAPDEPLAAGHAILGPDRNRMGKMEALAGCRRTN